MPFLALTTLLLTSLPANALTAPSFDPPRAGSNMALRPIEPDQRVSFASNTPRSYGSRGFDSAAQDSPNLGGWEKSHRLGLDVMRGLIVEVFLKVSVVDPLSTKSQREMSLKSERPRAQLTIPKVPNFPFSSPITEEIMTPASTSSDDREMERNRPFEFLSKVSNRNPFLYKPGSDVTQVGMEKNVSLTLEKRGKSENNSNICTGARNMERPVGLNLITDLPNSAPRPRGNNAAAPFVDLNDLKVLSKAREEERSVQGSKVILKKANNQGFKRLLDDPPEPVERNRTSILGAISKNPMKKFKDELSPSDRPIMIGFSVPYNESQKLHDEEKTKELDSAGTQQTPLTPSIIVTPAKEDGFWTGLHPGNNRLRIASSVYSQPTPYLGVDSEIPPVPAIPAFRLAMNNEIQSSDSPQTLTVTSVRKRRSFSTGTMLEKEAGQEQRARSRSYSNENMRQAPGRLSINTGTGTDRPTSYGWWNYLLSPLFSRTSTLRSRITPTEASHPPIPTIATHSTGSTSSTGSTDEWWEEKEVSYFSPDTPDATSATRGRIVSWQNFNGNPFADFDWSIDNQRENTSSNERGVPSFAFSGNTIQGAAAEYYQACAHELFSGRPYFECVNHVCSITPKDQIVNFNRDLTPGNVQTEKGLLIDVDDMPNPGNYEARKSLAATTIADSPEEQAMVNRGLDSPRHTILESPRASPFINSGNRDTGALGPVPEYQYEKQNTNPFFQAPSTVPLPFTSSSVHVQPAAVQAPSVVHVPRPAAQEPIPMPSPDLWPRVAPPVAQEPIPMPSPDPMPRGNIRAGPPSPPSQVAMPSPTQIPPPSYGAQAYHPYPTSPGLLEATERGGSIRLDDMPSGPAPAYTAHDNSYAVLPPRIAAVPITRQAMGHPLTERGRLENRRRRLEREDAIGKKAGGLWRGRGPFSNKGCFGRPGREGRLRRRWYLVILLLFIIIVVGAVLLAIFLTRSGDQTPVQSQWLNLTGYPPMPTGISTIAGPEAQVQEPGCITPSSLWSCALPKEQQSDNEPYSANQPNFRVEIRFRNGTYDRSTTLASRSDNQLFNPSPLPPDMAEQAFLGNTTDKNSLPYAGEETPFYMTVLSPAPVASMKLARRTHANDTSSFPDVGSLIPSPSLASDGTAAPATLYPLPTSQPVRLYNRGQKDEHYGFYTYFDKSIFLKSSLPITGQKDDSTSTEDANGGSKEADARVRCTWSQTRFLVQIWTKPAESGKQLLQNTNATTALSATATTSPSSTSQPTSSSSATDFTRPGSFPYPVTITLDRHGGKVTEKVVYCYGMETDQHINGTEKKLQLEDRSFNGVVFNPAPGLFNTKNDSSTSDLGGYDGGTGGCSCQWTNWIGTI